MKRLLRLCAGLMLSFGLCSPTGATQSTPPSKIRIDVSKLGPQIGERVPDFSLKDQNGNIQTLQSIMGRRGAVLVFLRSADW